MADSRSKEFVERKRSLSLPKERLAQPNHVTQMTHSESVPFGRGLEAPVCGLAKDLRCL